MLPRFRDREHAGRVLAGLLLDYSGRPDLLVLGLSRGGVPVAFAVAAALEAPLDVLLVRTLGAPERQDLHLGAVASGGVHLLREEAVAQLGITEGEIRRAAEREGHELERQERVFRGERPLPDMSGRIAILVDDSLWTGVSMCAAARAVQGRGAASLLAAVPVAGLRACEVVRDEVDDVICALTPEPYESEAAWYKEFAETSDAEVRVLLELAGRQFGRRSRQRGAFENSRTS